MKPNLACDWKQDKIKFPAVCMPKLDGVRALNNQGVLFGRSMKPIANLFTRRYFSHDHLQGIDGELAAELETHADLCRLTTSAVQTVEGEPWVMWWAFDLYDAELDYWNRLLALEEKVRSLQAVGAAGADRIKVVPYRICNTLEEVIAFDDENLAAGYEGTIGRWAHGKYKQGRSTANEATYWRIKRFIDGEIIVDEVLEGQQNNNELEQNELGYAKRSTHQENMVPNQMVGALMGTAMGDVVDPSTGNVVIQKGQRIKIGAGAMNHQERSSFFKDQSKILGKIAKFKFFPKGIKDKPRFPIFTSLRDPADM